MPTAAQAMRQFSAARPYRHHPRAHLAENPYRRPLDAGRLAQVDLDQPLREDQFASDASLIVNRYLMNVYESDALFLPDSGLTSQARQDYEAFYSAENRLLGEISRRPAEEFTLGFLEDSVKISGNWDPASLEAHLDRVIADGTTAVSPVLQFIDKAPEPKLATEMLIAQMALDGLTEATAMSQNLGGSFGPEQSELFKIFIDEFGYGVHGAKHSTLFKELCVSVGMSPEPHYYWFFYLPSSIALNNYFYVATKNRTGFFRYVGAMAYLEATFAAYFKQLGTTLRNVYGESVDARYSDEHAHIDQHHGKMAVQDLVLPLAAKHGPHAAREMVRGVEEIRLLGALADEDLLGQLNWHPEVFPSDKPASDASSLELGPTRAFETQVASETRLVTVLRGHADLHWRPTGAPLRIESGQSVEVPAGRLYGLRSDAASTAIVTPAR